MILFIRGININTTKIINLLHNSVKKRTYDFVPTQKNRNSRRKYGLTIEELEYFFLTICESDLYKGPEEDRDIPGDIVFIFKKEIIRGVSFYVKIKKDNSVNYDRIKIISCHEDEF